MPCHDPPWPREPRKKTTQEKKLEALLCSVCKILVRLQYDFGENPALDIWWDKHKKEDELKLKGLKKE